MTQEDKELLLKDLCSRLPYGVKIWIKWDKNPSPLTTSILENYWYTVGDDIKPYLRPMSSMTEEEKKDFIEVSCYEVEETVNGRHYEYYLKDYVGTTDNPTCNYDAIDWLNQHHFDYRGLIEKGLALEAPDGMYKIGQDE